MPQYETILNIINETLDNHNISTTDICDQMKVNRGKMVEFRNGDTKDSNLLYEIFDFLFPDRAQQDIVFLKEMLKSVSLIELQNLYNNNDLIREYLTHIKTYQVDDIMNDVLRNIVIKNTTHLLREVNNEDNPMC